MTISIGDHNKNSQSTGGVDCVVTLTTQASGSVIVAGLNLDGTFTSFGDNKGNTFTQIQSQAANGTNKHRLYYVENAVGGASHTFTFASSGGTIKTLFVLEIKGLKTSGSLDANPAHSVDTASPFTSNSTGALAQADEIVVSGCILDGNGAITEANGFTIADSETNGGVFWTGAMAYKIVSATTAQSTSFTEGGAGGGVVSIASFRMDLGVAPIIMGGICL